jgi:hypothetical protein
MRNCHFLKENDFSEVPKDRVMYPIQVQIKSCFTCAKGNNPPGIDVQQDGKHSF